MIINCKTYILTFKEGLTDTATKKSRKKDTGGLDDSVLWDHTKIPHDELINVLRSCLQLHETYVHQYEFTKKRLEHMPKTK